MNWKGPRLVGIRGVVCGERFPLFPGQMVLVGRSHGCEISLGKCRLWLETPPPQQAQDADFNTVSRRHASIVFRMPDLVEIVDLSSNGTFVDNRQATREVLRIGPGNSHEIRLGTRETLRLEWAASEVS